MAEETEIQEEVSEEVLEGEKLEETKDDEGKTESPEESAKKQEDEKQKARNRLSDRNKVLTGKWREEERKRVELENRLKELEEAQKIKTEPDEDDYSDSEKYRADKEKWEKQKADELKAKARQEAIQEIQNENFQKEIKKKQDVYIKNRESFVKEDEKFHGYEVEIDDAVTKYGAPEIQNLILDLGENGPKLVKYLGTHPDELEKIASSSPLNRAFLMGQIVPKLDAKTVKTVSSAPNPTREVKGSAQRMAPSGIAYDPKKESFREYAIRMNKK